MKTIKFIFPLFFILLFDSCQEEKIEATKAEEDYKYLPLEVGKFIVYKYDSLLFDNKGLDKYNYSGFIKEEVAEMLSEKDGEVKYKIIKYWRKNPTDAWKLTDVETQTLTSSQSVRTEENLPFIKMVFPNPIKTRWSGNALFDETLEIKVLGETMKIYDDWKYEITSKDAPLSINNLNFSNTLEIVQRDNSKDAQPSVLNKRFSREIYAKGIGLVLKEMKMYDTQKVIPDTPWENYAQKGYSLLQTVVEHN